MSWCGEETHSRVSSIFFFKGLRGHTERVEMLSKLDQAPE